MSGLIALLVRVLSQYCEVTGSNPFEVLNFSGSTGVESDSGSVDSALGYYGGGREFD